MAAARRLGLDRAAQRVLNEKERNDWFFTAGVPAAARRRGGRADAGLELREVAAAGISGRREREHERDPFAPG